MKDLDYLVIFMERPLEQVVRSQREMLRRQGKSGTILSDERLRNVFLRQIKAGKLVPFRQKDSYDLCRL